LKSRRSPLRPERDVTLLLPEKKHRKNEEQFRVTGDDLQISELDTGRESSGSHQ